MSTEVCRWGILSTAGIARKNWKAIRLSGNSRIAAVASRSVDAAERFIDECSQQAPTDSRPVALGSYEELLERDDVDAVYVPIPTAMRHKWVIRAAEAGKHVLGEKPAALNAKEVAEMLDACKQNKVQYMDGVMFMHSQRLPLLRGILNEKRLGRIRRLAIQFSFAGDQEFQTSNIRTNSELEPYGCLGDLGWYCSRMFLWIMQGEMPKEVRARRLTDLQGSNSPKSVPGEFSAELQFEGGVSASFYNSFLTEHQQWLHISGDKGYVRIDDFVLPYHGPEVDLFEGHDVFHVDNCEFHMESHLKRHAVREYDANAAGAQEVRMIQHFSDLVLQGVLDEQWPEWTLKTQRVLDACFESATKNGQPVQID
jgi:predicted dehydrogenase